MEKSQTASDTEVPQESPYQEELDKIEEAQEL
jgi:hypothetical protein